MWFGEHPLACQEAASTPWVGCALSFSLTSSLVPDAALYRLLTGLPQANGVFWQLPPLPRLSLFFPSQSTVGYTDTTLSFLVFQDHSLSCWDTLMGCLNVPLFMIMYLFCEDAGQAGDGRGRFV